MFRNVFRGRYGLDAFSLFLLFVAFLFLSTRSIWFILAGLAVVGYVLFRAFSLNFDRRGRELWWFNNAMQAAVRFFQRIGRTVSNATAAPRMRWRDRKTFLYVRCPQCRKVLRLPRHRGTLLVKCTVCGHSFKKKTGAKPGAK